MSEANNNRVQQMKSVYASKTMFGRRKILTSADAITADNVVKVIEQAYNVHLLNRGEIEYLWNYYKGKQPSLYRVREVRDELTSHIVENRNKIVSQRRNEVGANLRQRESHVIESA